MVADERFSAGGTLQEMIRSRTSLFSEEVGGECHLFTSVVSVLSLIMSVLA